MMDSWMDVCTLVMICVLNGCSVADQQLHSIIATWNVFMMDPWMDVYSLVMISAINGSSVAE